MVSHRYSKAHQRRDKADLFALGGFVVLVAAFYAPLLLGVARFPDGDFTHQFLPFNLFLRKEWLAGRLPVWNPYTYSGHPFLADVQAAVFYPLSNLILLLTLPWSAPAARLYFLEIEAALHLVLAGFFTYLLARDLSRHRGAAFLSGCAFAFSGYLTGYPPLQLSILRTAIWLPLVLWLLLRAFKQPTTWRWWIGATLGYTSAFLAGHAQTFLFLSYVVGGWIILLLLWKVRRSPAGWSNLIPSLLGVACFYVLSLGLSAAQLWPSIEFTQLSTRAHADYAFLSGGFPLRDTWQMLLPGMLTRFSPLYVSVTALGLALLSLGSLVAHFRRSAASRTLPASPGGLPFTWGALFFALVSVLFLLLSYGDNGFLYALYYRWAPGGQLFRGQERAAYGVAFGLSILAGYGAAAMERLPVGARRLAACAFVCAVAVGIIAFGLWRWLPQPIDMSHHELLMTAGAVLAFTVLSGLLVSTNRLADARVPVLTALIVCDLFLANFTTNLEGSGPGGWTALTPEVLAVRAAIQEPDETTLGLPGRVYHEYRVYENYGMVTEIEDVWGGSPLRLARYAMLVEDVPPERMWRLTGVEHILIRTWELSEPSVLLAVFPQAEDTTYYHRLAEPNPRAWLANRVRFVDDAEALRLLADDAFDLETTALLPLEERARFQHNERQTGLLASGGRNAIHLKHMAPNRLTVRVWSEHGGLLLISENWMPGWQAVRRNPEGQVETVPVLRANLTFLGLRIPAGQWTIELLYRPTSVQYGLLISGASLVVLILMGVWRWCRGVARRR